VSELANQLVLLMTVLWVVGVVLAGGYLAGRALRIHLVIAIFLIGSAYIAYLAYREIRHPDFAHYLVLSFLLLIELGLTVMLATGLVRRWKGRRLERDHVAARAS
jgi:hypothetical protein